MAVSMVQVLYLRIGDDAQVSVFDDLYQVLLAKVASASTTQKAKSAAAAQSLLATQSFKAVLILHRTTNMDNLWSIFGLPWKYGDYHRTTFYLSQRMKTIIGQDRAVRLLREYSMKANHLKNVTERWRVYVPLEQSQSQSAVFPPSAMDQGQTPAAFHKYGEGWLGFIGDVNNEQGTQALLMAMLGKPLPNLRCRRSRITQGFI
ncbi:MAG: hypothetical protein Q9171_003268 [Xanthocarpia ochracea]